MQPNEPAPQQPVTNPVPPQPPTPPQMSMNPVTGQLEQPVPQAVTPKPMDLAMGPPTDQPMQPMVPAQPQQQSAPAGQPFYSAKCWYIPTGKRGAYSAKPGMANVYAGTLVIIDLTTNQEVRRWPLQGSKVKNSVGSCRISEVNGQKIGMTNAEAQIYFFNPKMLLLTNIVMFMSAGKSKHFYAALKQGGAV